MAARESKILGPSATYQSQWDDLLNKKIIVNGIPVEKNIVTRAFDQIGAAAAYPFRDPTGGNTGESGQSLTGQVATAQVGRFQVGEWLNSNTKTNSFLSSAGNMTSGIIEGSASALASGIGAIGNTVNVGAGKIGSINIETKKVDGFIAPVFEMMDAIKKIGKDFDDLIKTTFLGQIFKIKGSEILCALFCIIISFLSCKERSDLNDAIVRIKNGIRDANNAINSINELTKDPVEVPLFNSKTIADDVKSLFPAKYNTGISGNALRKALNTPDGTSTKKPVIPDVPPDVKKTISNIVMLISVIAKGQINVPVGVTGNIWNFSQVVLGIIQSVVTQLVDEFLTKVVSQIEKKLKSMIPQMCVGNLAVKFINKIMDAIRALKAYLLDQIKILLGESSKFTLQWKKFGWHFKELQELLAILKALGLILKAFPELALMCGISPCNNLPSKELEEIGDNIRAGLKVKETNMPARLVSDIPLPQGKTLDELASTFTAMTGQPDAYAVANPNGGFHVIMPDMFKDAPSKIQEIINSPDFLSALGGAYTVYQQPDSGMHIVYTYELKC